MAESKEAQQQSGVFGIGEKNTAYAKYFVGQSYLNMLTTERVVTANVTFEPGCRNNWHIHHKGGQILLVTSGLVSGMGPAGTGTACRRCRQHSAGSQALARRCQKQLVCSCSH